MISDLTLARIRMDLNERDWLDAVARNELSSHALESLGNSYLEAREHFRALYQKASGLNTSTHAEGVSSATKAGARCHLGSAHNGYPMLGSNPGLAANLLENLK